MIYEQPSIYKSGLSIEDINKINKWENITDKLGKNSTMPTTCSVNIQINRFLKLLNIRSFGGFSIPSTSDRPIFDYNNDVPEVLNFDCLARNGSSGQVTLLTSDSINKKIFIYASGISYIDWAIQSSIVLIGETGFNLLLQYIDQ